MPERKTGRFSEGVRRSFFKSICSIRTNIDSIGSSFSSNTCFFPYRIVSLCSRTHQLVRAPAMEQSLLHPLFGRRIGQHRRHAALKETIITDTASVYAMLCFSSGERGASFFYTTPQCALISISGFVVVYSDNTGV